MSVEFKPLQFLADETGAITVDWTVLSAAAVGLAIALTAALTNTFDGVSGIMDAELRSRSMSDDWVLFSEEHFEDILQSGTLTQEEAEAAYDAATPLMNHDLIDALASGIELLEEGTLTSEQLVDLIAIASVAHQRNVVDDAVLDYYFGFGGSEPYYATAGLVPPPPTQ